MKSVVRIQGQGKAKDVGLLGLAAMPAAEQVNTTVALIQALIRLGLKAVEEALEAEVTTLAGECGTVAAVAAQAWSAGARNEGRSTSPIRSCPLPTSACRSPGRPIAGIERDPEFRPNVPLDQLPELH